MGIGFLDLPPELRIQVYQEFSTLFKSKLIPIIRRRPNKIHRYVRPIARKFGIESRSPNLALLRTCRTVRQEASQIICGACRFGLWLSDCQGCQSSFEELVSTGTSFVKIFKPYLHSIQHMEIGIQDLYPFITKVTYHKWDMSKSLDRRDHLAQRLTRLIDGNEFCSSCETNEGGKMLLRWLDEFARFVPNVRSVTCHQHEHESGGARVVRLPAITLAFSITSPKLEEVRVLLKQGQSAELRILKRAPHGDLQALLRFNQRPGDPSSPTAPQQAARACCTDPQTAWEGAENARVSLLLVCRTVYEEAVGLVYQNGRLAFWVWNAKGLVDAEHTVVEEIRMFKSIFVQHLSFVQHLDLGLHDLIRFLPTPVMVDESTAIVEDYQANADRTLTRLLDVPHNNDRDQGSFDEHHLLRYLEILGNTLPNVRTVTYHQHWDGYNLYRKPSPEIEEKLKDYFPNLETVRILKRIDNVLTTTVLEIGSLAKQDDEIGVEEVF